MNIKRLALEATTALSVSAVVGGIVATELAAWKMGFHSSIGAAWLTIRGLPIYAPWSIVSWAPWMDEVPGIKLGLAAGVLASAGLLSSWVVGLTQNKKTSEFGKGAWGTARDLKRAGLLAKPPSGSVLGVHNGKLINFNGDQHQLVTGAAGSGKTHGPVISTLLTCRNSVLAIDPKRALYKNTARWRSTIGPALYFDPTDPDSVCINPLSEITPETEIAQSQNIAAILVSASGLNNTNPIWPIKATDLLTGLILAVVHHVDDDKKHIGHIRDLLAQEDKTYELMQCSHHPEVRGVGNKMVPLDKKISQSISVTASATLDAFADPMVVSKTSRSDFRLSDLVCGDEPVSLYLQVRASEARRLRPLQRIIMSQIKRAMMYDLDIMPDGRKKKHRLSMILEEFPAMGRDEDFEYDLRQFREYGITAIIFCQSILDLEAVYGSSQTILDNCHVVVCFAASNPRSLKDISILLGRADEQRVSESRKRGISGMFSGSKSTSSQRRLLMDEGEIRQLSLDEQLLFVTGSPPFRTQKVRWFDNKVLAKRGTNMRKGGVAPGQNPHFLKNTTAIGDCKDIPQQTVVGLLDLDARSHRAAVGALLPDASGGTAFFERTQQP